MMDKAHIHRIEYISTFHALAGNLSASLLGITNHWGIRYMGKNNNYWNTEPIVIEGLQVEVSVYFFTTTVCRLHTT